MHIKRKLLYWEAFIATIPVAGLSYFASPFFLERGVSEIWIGSIYILSAVLGLVITIIWPRIVKIFRASVLEAVIIATISVSFLGLEYSLSVKYLVMWFLLLNASSLAHWMNSDILLERTVEDENETGRVRSYILTTYNLAYFIAPIASGYLIVTGSYSLLFSTSALLAAFAGFISVRNIPPIRTVVPHHEYEFFTALIFVSSNPDVRRIFLSQFTLYIFYAFAIIYVPVYFTSHLGFETESFGILMTIALLAFPIVQIPAGLLDDLKFGEKEIMTLGYTILIFTTMAMQFMTGSSFLAWAILLFVNRAGAALIEEMNESAFFKHIDSKKTGTIGIFRMMTPLAIIFGSALGTLFLSFYTLEYMPIALGIILIILSSLSVIGLKDTK